MIIGNWKMHKTSGEARQFIHSLIPFIQNISTSVFLAVPFTAISSCVEAAEGLKLIIGAQNMHDADEGAFTGEISASMLKEAGASFVILGHSERRQLFYETDAFINRKVRSALQSGLQPIVCIGETQEERALGKTQEVLTRQLKDSLFGLDLTRVVVAYEPIWAIGTGQAATPAIAQTVHAFIREPLPKKNIIISAGSVNPGNLTALLSEPDINGALVGGASLNVEDFAQLITLRNSL